MNAIFSNGTARAPHTLVSATEIAQALNISKCSIHGRLIHALLSFVALHILKLKKMNELYETAAELGTAENFLRKQVCPKNFCANALRALNITVECSLPVNPSPPENCIYVANHPTGACEALLLISLLLAEGKNLKVLGNAALVRIPELAPVLLAVDPYETESSVRQNLRALKLARAHLNAGGSLLAFPAGEVSSFSFRDMRITDRPWNENIARLARSAQASIVPVFVTGRNSTLFYVFSFFSFRLRQALFARELFRCKNKVVSCRQGNALPPGTSMKTAQIKAYDLGFPGRPASNFKAQ